ncbi:MAG: DUF2726 domain-containing protein [Rhodothermales bacterium]|nr:DUF2726 domain-containing protein [Rhodothermales bacterium]
MTDPEALYRLAYEQRWADALAAVHREHAALPGDPMLAAAAETLTATFLAAVQRDGPGPHADALETLFLLHTGAFYALPPPRFEAVVEALVTIHAGRPEAARAYARYCPENARCAAVLATAPVPVAPPGAEALDVAAHPPAGPDAVVGLFRSHQEAEFFLAVREVFATYLVYPNVALHSVLDYDRLRPHLSGAERRYFFQALVDCVVFDQHDGYRPRFFFELDSPLHDAPERQAKDRAKEHILAAAGQTLYRIRKRTAHAGRADFVALLKRLALGTE